jgi:hypothetical protein
LFVVEMIMFWWKRLMSLIHGRSRIFTAIHSIHSSYFYISIPPHSKTIKQQCKYKVSQPIKKPYKEKKIREIEKQNKTKKRFFYLTTTATIPTQIPHPTSSNTLHPPPILFPVLINPLVQIAHSVSITVTIGSIVPFTIALVEIVVTVIPGGSACDDTNTVPLEGVAVTVTMVGGIVTTDVDAVTVVAGGVTVDVCGGGAAEIVVPGDMMASVVTLVVSWRVPIIVAAPFVTEVPSATRFHLRKPAIVIKGTCSGGFKGEGEGGGGSLPLAIGISILPVLVAFVRMEYSVIVVVKVLVVDTFSKTEDTTRVVVTNEVVETASVRVAIGEDSVPAGAENIETVSPAGIVVVPLTTVAKGFGPPEIVNGPICAIMACRLFT